MTYLPLRLRRLTTGVRPADALRSLQETIDAAEHARVARDAADKKDRYLEWVETVEAQLRWLTIDPDVRGMLQTERYWRIRALDETDPRPWPLMDAEIELQVDALKPMAADLQARVETLAAAPGHVTVLDTNVLLHYLPPADIDWRRVADRSEVRLVIPLRVVEELDAKKYSGSAKLADRARRLLPQLEAVLGSGGDPARLRDGVTIEALVPGMPREAPTDGDEEVLAGCVELEVLTSEKVKLVTGDTAMRIRAQALGVEVVRMPDEYLRG